MTRTGTANFVGQSWGEVQVQWQTVWPTWLSMLVDRLPWLFTIMFTAALGSNELAAASLACSLVNVTSLCLFQGLSTAISTLTGQACGDLLKDLCSAGTISKGSSSTCPISSPGLSAVQVSHNVATDSSGEPDSRRALVYVSSESLAPKSADGSTAVPLLPLIVLYRGILVQLMFMVPIGIWWLVGTESVLVCLGQDTTVATMTSTYLKYLVPGLWFDATRLTASLWLQTIEMADVPAYVSALGMASCIPLNFFYIYGLGWGYLGAAAATSTYQLIQPLLTFTYIFATASGSRRVLENTGAQAIGRTELSFWKEFIPAVTSVKGIWIYLGLAIPGSISKLDWVASEVVVFMSGRLVPDPEVALGATNLYQSMNIILATVSNSVRVAGSSRVSYLLGSGQAQASKRAAEVNVIAAFTLTTLLGTLLFVIPHTFFPSLIVPTQTEVIAQTARTITLLALYIVADGTQLSLTGILTACGRQRVTVPVVLFSYWLVGIPISYYLAFVMNDGLTMCDNYFCGIVGLTAGLTIGTWCHFLILALIVAFTTDWKEQVKSAKHRLSHERHSSVTNEGGGPRDGTVEIEKFLAGDQVT